MWISCFAARPNHFRIWSLACQYCSPSEFWAWWCFYEREHRFAGMLLPFLIVTVLSVVYVPLALLFKPYFSWWVILVPLFLVAIIYVVLMYLKDAQTVAPGWAAFLGLLRSTVYAILAFVFLLPGCQTYKNDEFPSKVIFLFDVSGSIRQIDDLPEVGQDPATLPARQDKVIDLLTGRAALVQKVLEKSPITAYRFGTVADEVDKVDLDKGQVWTAAQWAAWLKPDKKRLPIDPKRPEEEQLKERGRLSDLIDSLTEGTNVGGSALQIAKAESASFVQAIVIFSDGQSNVGGDEATKEFLARVNNQRRPINVFTVGVGEYRQPASIRIDDLQTPEVVRPDDKFPVRVPVVGSGLEDEDFEVAVELTRVEDGLGRPVTAERRYTLDTKKGKFKGGGDHPNDTVEFEIDLQELKGLKSLADKNGRPGRDLASRGARAPQPCANRLPRPNTSAIRPRASWCKRKNSASCSLPAVRAEIISSCARCFIAKSTKSAWRCRSCCKPAMKITSIRTLKRNACSAAFPIRSVPPKKST